MAQWWESRVVKGSKLPEKKKKKRSAKAEYLLMVTGNIHSPKQFTEIQFSSSFEIKTGLKNKLFNIPDHYPPGKKVISKREA